MWFYVCAYVVCVGAEVNAALEFRARTPAHHRAAREFSTGGGAP